MCLLSYTSPHLSLPVISFWAVFHFSSGLQCCICLLHCMGGVALQSRKEDGDTADMTSPAPFTLVCVLQAMSFLHQKTWDRQNTRCLLQGRWRSLTCPHPLQTWDVGEMTEMLIGLTEFLSALFKWTHWVELTSHSFNEMLGGRARWWQINRSVLTHNNT